MTEFVKSTWGKFIQKKYYITGSTRVSIPARTMTDKVFLFIFGHKFVTFSAGVN